jgi:hypothetical protein
MKNSIISVIMIFVVLLILGLSWAGYCLKRKINYKFGYETMVQQQIDAAMVKHIQQYHK